jgi:uncharacterized protein
MAAEMISIREARTEDLEALRRINAESAPDVSLLDAGTMQMLAATATVAWVALARGAISGYLVGFAHPAPYEGEEFIWVKNRCQDFVFVDQVAVAARCRGLGVGAALYAALERWAVRKHLRRLACGVNLEPPNPRSFAFHHRQGFIEIGRMKTTEGLYVALLRKEIRALQGPGDASTAPEQPTSRE